MHGVHEAVGSSPATPTSEEEKYFNGLFSENMITCKNNFGGIVQLPEEKFQFRPSVYGIIRNAGEICVCKTRSTEKIWFPGGGVDRGESLVAGLQREIKEETGLEDIEIGRLLGVFENFFYFQPTDEAMQAFLFFYECFTSERNLLSDEEVDDPEAHDFRWMRVDQIRAEDLADLNEEVFKLIHSLK